MKAYQAQNKWVWQDKGGKKKVALRARSAGLANRIAKLLNDSDASKNKSEPQA